MSSHALDRNVEKMFDLWAKVYSGVHFDNEAYLQSLLRMIAVSLVLSHAVMSTHTCALSELAAGQCGSVRTQSGHDSCGKVRWARRKGREIQQRSHWL